MSCTYVPQLQKSEVVRWGTFSILVDLTRNDPSCVQLHWFAVPLVWCICRLGCILLFFVVPFLSLFFVLLYADKRVHIHTILTFVVSTSSLSVRVQLWEQHTRDASVSLWIQPDQRAEISACNSTNRKQTAPLYCWHEHLHMSNIYSKLLCLMIQ